VIALKQAICKRLNNSGPVLILLLLKFTLNGQINYADIYDTHFNTHASRYYPSMLGTSFGSAEVDLLNVYGWAGNSNIPYKYLSSLIFGQQLTESQIKTVIDHAGAKNNFFVGADIQLIGAAFKVKSGKRGELFSMEFGERERIMGNIQISKNLLNTILEGNEQFSGQTVSLDPIGGSAVYLHDFYLGASAPIPIKAGTHSLELRPGLRGNFLLGTANVYAQSSNTSMYTDPEGKYINFNYNYFANSAIPTSVSDAVKGTGKGWGLNGGIGVTLDDYLSFDLDVIDAGKLYFKNDVNNFSNNTTYQFTGVSADLFQNGGPNVSFNFNDNLLKPVQTENAYSTPLGTKITFRAEYRLVESPVSKKDSLHTYFQHHLFLTYVQGMQNIYNTTTVPNFSVGYMYSVKNILNVGLSAGFLGYNKFSLGPFISLKGGAFVFSIGSNNLMALIAPGFGTGLDAYFNIGFNIGSPKTKLRKYAPSESSKPQPAIKVVVTARVKIDTITASKKESISHLSSIQPAVTNTSLRKVASVAVPVFSADKNLAEDSSPKNIAKPDTIKTITVPVKAAEPKPAENELTFRIQLCAIPGPYKDADKAKALFGEVSSETLASGVTRYYGGNAKNMADARKLLSTAKSSGYNDAFIVGTRNGKRISNDEMKPYLEK
jgi:hypothetical protein